MFLKFECPECNGEYIEEIFINAWVTVTFYGIDDYGPVTVPEGVTIHEADLAGYQCGACGWRIPKINSFEELEFWLKEQKYNEEK